MNLAKRVATAAVGIPLLLFAVFNRTPIPFAGGYLYFLFPLFVTLLGASELNTLLDAGSAVKPRRLLYLLFAMTTVSGSFGPLDLALPHRVNWMPTVSPAEWFALFVLAALFSIAAARLAGGKIIGAVGDAGQALLVLGGLALPASFLALLWRLPGGDWRVLFLLLVTWAMDTGGYFIGSRFGKTPLAPAISPKKTIAGFWGGLGAAVLVSLLMVTVSSGAVPRTAAEALLLGVTLALGGQLGDLVESLVKRELRVKDSGTLLPGHGGVLDRFDALLFNAPLLYLYFVAVAG